MHVVTLAIERRDFARTRVDIAGKKGVKQGSMPNSFFVAALL